MGKYVWHSKEKRTMMQMDPTPIQCASLKSVSCNLKCFVHLQLDMALKIKKALNIFVCGQSCFQSGYRCCELNKFMEAITLTSPQVSIPVVTVATIPGLAHCACQTKTGSLQYVTDLTVVKQVFKTVVKCDFY